MKYIKLYENNTNPIFVKLYDKIVEILKNIYDCEVILSNESNQLYAFIKITSPDDKLSADKGYIFAIDEKKYISLITYYRHNIVIDNLITFLSQPLSSDKLEYKYSEIDSLIKKLDGFELWLTAKKYNL